MGSIDRSGGRPTRSLEKKLAQKVQKLQEKYPSSEIQLWCEDEHRLGLKPAFQAGRFHSPKCGALFSFENQEICLSNCS